MKSKDGASVGIVLPFNRSELGFDILKLRGQMKFRKLVLITFLQTGKYYGIIVDIKYPRSESLTPGEAMTQMPLLTFFYKFSKQKQDHIHYLFGVAWSVMLHHFKVNRLSSLFVNLFNLFLVQAFFFFFKPSEA